MKRVVVVGFLSVGMMLTGCSNSVIANPIATSKATPAYLNKLVIPEPIPVPTQSIDTSKLVGFDTNASSAIAPAQVDIGNFYPGATAEFDIIIHNGDGLKNKLLQITTDSGETVAAIPLNVVLANSGLLDIQSIDSSLPGERLEATAYDTTTKLITIRGFAPSETRVVKITYKTISVFKAYYKAPSKTKAGFTTNALATDWVSFDNPEIQLRPMENGKVKVILEMPKTAQAFDKWEFWVAVTERGMGQGNQIATEIELCSRILVTMR